VQKETARVSTDTCTGPGRLARLLLSRLAPGTEPELRAWTKTGWAGACGWLTHTHAHDWAALHKNLDKARMRWAQISRALPHKGVAPQVSVVFHKAAVQAELLCGCETWTTTSCVVSVLESFHHRVAR
jgi:hypothetical protein